MIGFVLACSTMVLAQGVVMLTVAIFLLRQSGQGLMSHIAATSMARYYNDGRGWALAIGSFGESIGEALLPFLAVIAIGVIGWRSTYGVSAALIAVVLIPLLRGQSARHQAYLTRDHGAGGLTNENARSATRGEVLRDVRFWLLLPGLLAPSMISTAMFFHHLNIADVKGWSHAWITGNYVLYAVAGVGTAFFLGPLIDRFGAMRFLPFKLLPLILALGVMALFDSAYTVWPYFLLLGLSSGTHVLVTAMRAEIYGVDHLGAIKSLVTALEVFASAIGPVIIGVMLDSGLSFATSLTAFAIDASVGTVLLWVGVKRR